MLYWLIISLARLAVSVVALPNVYPITIKQPLTIY